MSQSERLSSLSLEKTEGLEFRIKEVAKLKKVKAYELADKLGISPTYISKIDNGKVNTTIKTLQSIADTLGVPVHELIKLPEGYGHFYVEEEWQGIRKL